MITKKVPRYHLDWEWRVSNHRDNCAKYPNEKHDFGAIMFLFPLDNRMRGRILGTLHDYFVYNNLNRSFTVFEFINYVKENKEKLLKIRWFGKRLYAQLYDAITLSGYGNFDEGINILPILDENGNWISI